MIILLAGVRNRYADNTQRGQNVEDIPLSPSKRKQSDDQKSWLIAFFTQAQDPASLGVFRVLFGKYHLKTPC